MIACYPPEAEVFCLSFLPPKPKKAPSVDFFFDCSLTSSSAVLPVKLDEVLFAPPPDAYPDLDPSFAFGLTLTLTRML